MSSKALDISYSQYIVMSAKALDIVLSICLTMLTHSPTREAEGLSSSTMQINLLIVVLPSIIITRNILNSVLYAFSARMGWADNQLIEPMLYPVHAYIHIYIYIYM